MPQLHDASSGTSTDPTGLSARAPRASGRPTLDIDAYVREVIDHAPPLTAQQRARLSSLVHSTRRYAQRSSPGKPVVADHRARYGDQQFKEVSEVDA